MKKFIYILVGLIVLMALLGGIVILIEDRSIFRESRKIDYELCKSLDNPEELCAPLLKLSPKQRRTLINEGLLY